jgi:SAM-dependent methyltransferase
MASEAATGTENLEAMEEARNYNAHLLSLAARASEAGGSVLDFGAGLGTFARPMRDAGRTVVCIEPDPDARSGLRAAGMEAHASLADAPPRLFDGIYTFNVLEHIDDDAAALSGLYERLRPGGRLIVYVPAFQVLFSAMDRAVGHRRRYRRGALKRAVEQAGFRVSRARYVDSLGFLAALVFRLAGNDSGRISPASVRLYDRFVFPVSRVLDAVCCRWFGKNLLIEASRDR